MKSLLIGFAAAMSPIFCQAQTIEVPSTGQWLGMGLVPASEFWKAGREGKENDTSIAVFINTVSGELRHCGVESGKCTHTAPAAKHECKENVAKCKGPPRWRQE